MRYFHGGKPGLKVGEYLLPPDRQTERTKGHLVDYLLPGQEKFMHRDKVYITTEKRIAKVFAAVLPNGALYEVEPEGEMTIDPDCQDGRSWMCEQAKIIKVVDPLVPFEERRLMSYLQEMTAE